MSVSHVSYILWNADADEHLRFSQGTNEIGMSIQPCLNCSERRLKPMAKGAMMPTSHSNFIAIFYSYRMLNNIHFVAYALGCKFDGVV